MHGPFRVGDDSDAERQARITSALPKGRTTDAGEENKYSPVNEDVVGAGGVTVGVNAVSLLVLFPNDVRHVVCVCVIELCYNSGCGKCERREKSWKRADDGVVSLKGRERLQQGVMS